MKKVLLGSLLVCTLSLVACSNNGDEEDTTAASTESKTEVTAAGYEEEGQDVAEMSFKDGKLETDYMKMSIDKTQVAHDNTMDEDGLVIWYTIENTSEDNIVPSEEWYLFTAKQQDDSTEYNLTDDIGYFNSAEALYPTEDENGEFVDDASWDEADANQTEFRNEYEEPADNELLPGKSKQFATGINLNNTEKPVIIQVGEEFPTSNNEEYKINLN
ncbi:DUF5067 domain-containing protein [Tetragenococcus solitarius]|uniref:DUF5067 domain-containing protein n=1 Tax=Tetragenococcus solitarius TaxID=71453 RepID=A0ABP6KPN0_9ENTE|nr:DUF5067 domain-containing protein [Tetragenococcus solitarius]